MLFYFALNILFALFSIIELLSRKCGITKLLFGTSVFILFILSFIRWETGTDWEHYLKMYFGFVFHGKILTLEWNTDFYL